MFSVLDEYTTWFKERFEFVLVELNQLSIMSRTGDDSFFQSLAKRQELLSKIVRTTYELNKKLNFSGGLSWNCLRSMLDIERSYYVLPGLLNDTLQSFLNRRGRDNINRYTPRKLKGPILSTASVHPTYAVSILSLECLSNSLHYKLNQIYGEKFAHLTPLTRLWESSQYSTTPLDYLKPILDPAKDNGYGIKVNDLLYLSGINLPRWAPHHIRVAGRILAHEHFHHVIYLVKLYLNSKAREEYDEHWLDELFGSLLVEMSQAFTDLIKELKKFLNTQNKYNPWQTPRIAEELLCDVAGFVLVGPAFSYALTLQLLPSVLRDGDDLYLNMTHPLPNVRIALQIELLKHFNFPNSASRLNKFSQPIIKFIRSSEYPKDVFELAKEFESWITDKDSLSIFYRFSKLLDDPIKIFCEVEQKPAFRGYCFARGEENRWEEKLEYLINEISENNVHFGLLDDNFSPIDVLNAFWLAKEQQYYKDGMKSTAHYLQLSWREWLSKYQKTHFLDKMED